MHLATLIAWSLLGAFYWTLLEYLLHRFAFHGHPRLLGRRHFQHHAKLDLPKLAVAPWQSGLAGAVIHAGIFLPLFGWATGGALFAGFLAGYGWYELAHYRIHYAAPFTRRAERLRDHHLAHHHGSPGQCFGVSTTFWDQIFGSQERRAPQQKGGAPV